MKMRRAQSSFNPEKFLATDANKAKNRARIRNPLRTFIILNPSFKENLYRDIELRHPDIITWDIDAFADYLRSALRGVKIRVGEDVFEMLHQDFLQGFAERKMKKRN